MSFPDQYPQYPDRGRDRNLSGGFGPGASQGGPLSPLGGRTPQRTPAPSWRQRSRTGLAYAAGYVVVIWVIHIVNTFVFGGLLTAFGIHPLDTSSLWQVLTSPLLHANFGHLISNTVPGAIFSFLIGASGARAWWGVTFLVVIVGGAGVWLFGGIGTNHIGASGLVYGWLAYLLVRGIFNRSFGQLAIGVILGVAYSGLIWGVLPGTPGISWQAHLFGAVGGVLAGMVITSNGAVALTRAQRQKQLGRGR